MTSPADANSVSESDRTEAAPPHRGANDETAIGNPNRIRLPGYRFGPAVGPGEVGTLGPYRVVKQLGRGGMGAVYAAMDTRLDRRLALKVMLPEYAADADAKARFLREARAAAQVAHDNVVTVFEADERDGVPYIAMQYLEGYPLDEFLQRKGCPTVPQVLRIVRETAAGLAAAHRIGLVHRDIKPGNLWLEAAGGRVKVLDFGLAKPVHSATELTQNGMVMGTPAYMSPEQARGQVIDARSDLFSLGAVMYRLCTGRLPFEGPTTMAVLLALATEEPVPVRERNPAVPDPVAALVHQLLAKVPDDRPQSAAEVMKRVQALASGNGASRVVVTPAARVVYVPIQVTAAVQANPFTDLHATEAEPALPVPPRDRTPEKSAPRKVRRKRRLSRGPVLGCGVVVALVLGAAVLGTKKTDGTVSQSDAPSSTPTPMKGREGKTVTAGPKWVGNEADRKAAEWVLSLGGAVSVDGQDQGLRQLGELPRDRYTLTKVNLSTKHVTDDDLLRLKECKGLTAIDLYETGVTDAGLIHLREVPELRVLNLAATGQTDGCAAHLKHHSRLTTLLLSRTKVTDAVLAPLKDVRELERLELSDTSISDAGLSHIKAFKKLTALDLNGTRVTDAGLVHLKDLPLLEHLELRSTGVTDAGLAHVSEIPTLKSLRLTSTRVTGAGLAHLRSLNGLSELHLDHTDVTDVGLEYLRGHPGVSYVNLSQTLVTERAVRAFHASAPSRQVISPFGLLGGTDPDRAADEWVRSLGGKSRVDETTGTGFTVTHIDVARAAFNEPELAYLKGLKGLTELRLSDTSVGDAGLIHLKDVKTLLVLDLSGTAVTDAGLAHLGGLTGLKRIDIGRTKVTDRGIKAFRAAVPGCVVERAGGPCPKKN